MKRNQTGLPCLKQALAILQTPRRLNSWFSIGSVEPLIYMTVTTSMLKNQAMTATPALPFSALQVLDKVGAGFLVCDFLLSVLAATKQFSAIVEI